MAFDIDKIESKIDKVVTGSMEINAEAGGLVIKTSTEAMEFAKMMATATAALPKHLRGNVGDVLSILMQANAWRMDPYAVARQSYFVNDNIAFQSQLMHALVNTRAPIKGRLKFSFDGDGATRVCTVWAICREDNERVEYISPAFGAINPKNSPLWKNDPDQQLLYFSVRAFARRNFPEVLLGVYAEDELRDAPPMKDVTPERENLAQRLKGQRRIASRRGFDHDHVGEALGTAKPVEHDDPATPPVAGPEAAPSDPIPTDGAVLLDEKAS
jgi:hypothetical protein